MGGFEEEDDRVDTGSLLRSALPLLPDLTGLRFPQVISSTYAGSADSEGLRGGPFVLEEFRLVVDGRVPTQLQSWGEKV